ncbi:hypothetical protein G6F68_015607 [Rhizopus microsporus]|nr:hypothetical protein G6F68_015607 [Rhizopus microsporus]
MRQRRVHREHRADDAGHVLILEHATVAAVMQPGGPVGQVHAVPHEAACAGQALDTADQPDPDNVCTVRQACGDACRPGHPIIQAVLARLAQQIDLAAQAFGQRFAAVPTLHDQPQCGGTAESMDARRRLVGSNERRSVIHGTLADQCRGRNPKSV